MTDIEILFKEYDTLRTETLGRQNWGFQLVLIAGATLAWLVTHARGWILWGGWVALFITYVLLAVRVVRDSINIGKRLIELEGAINALAGKPLLEWETKWGWAAHGWNLFR